MTKFVDIHSHAITNDPALIEIIVANIHTLTIAPPITNTKICVGLHPWEVDSFEMERFKPILKHYLSNPNFFALGEIGLDKVHKADYKKQMDIFEHQLDIANKFRIPRIVIHSVKAHSEIIQTLKSKNIKQKILIHDFYSSIETAKQYLQFDTYFSFGKKIFTNEKAQQALRTLPQDRIFLETDDQLDYNIFDIYQKACEHLEISLEELKEILFKNFQHFSS